MTGDKTGPWYLLRVLFKISDEQPVLFYKAVPPRDITEESSKLFLLSLEASDWSSEQRF